MALFKRKDKTAEMAKAVAAELAKAGNVGPYADIGYAYSASNTIMTNQNVPGTQIQVAGEAVPMPRPGGAFGAILGPAAPLIPAPLDPVLDESGRAVPRKYEYQVAQNLNITQTLVPYQILKSLVEQCDIIHRCVEIRVSEITKMDWSFTLANSTINEIMEEQNVSHAAAAKIGREKYGEEISRLTAFWENPYVSADRSFVEWMTEALWQVFTFDQLCVYPRYTLGAKLDAKAGGSDVYPIGFDVIDAPTIKILLDNRGDIPHPPAPGYEQILWGFPRGEFTASPDSDSQFYNGAGKSGQFLTDQLYVSVKNRRTWTVYGYSPVEQAIPAATLYLNRQRWLNAEYQEGASPKTWIKSNSLEYDPVKLAALERVLNDRLAGSTSERHRIKLLPDGFDPVAMASEDEKYKPDYDEFVIKRIASAFGVSPQALGIMPRSGLGGSGEHKGQQQSAEVVSQRPMESYVEEFINALSRRFLGMSKAVTFKLVDDESDEDMSTKIAAYSAALSSGQLTLNDIRGELGMPLYDMPEADEPFILSGSGPVFLKGSLETAKAQQQATVEQAEAGNDQGAQGTQDQEGSSQESAQGSQSEQASGEGSEAKDNVEAEKAAFAKFVKARTKAGKWRDFEFEHLDAETAQSLNETGKAAALGGDIPKERWRVL